ncbi:glycoside hydrolase family 2 protein [Natronorubrum daqingense]|uniref:Beta-mannosidase n=1 Tax=Natronorubrum daqingense TaxID=588898 RepID=A0A1N6YVU3_9EURY|nr:glycoside hydrolase family 2 [Natronorubrum daqingense]APX95547.1 glycoside hydrolase family 2 [Natronorubrum daqingense]SIR18744.1 beta-mannosidase [Natronorubrum daqingense]
MDDKWTGGHLTDRDEGPPTVRTWRPISEFGDLEPSTADSDALAYRTILEDPRRNESDRALLTLEGDAPRVELWLGGSKRGEYEPFAGPLPLEFDPETESELIVVCEPDGSNRDPESAGTEEVGEASTSIRARQPPGVRWSVDVEARPQTFLRRLEVRPRLTEDGGIIDVELEIDAGRAIDDAITLSLRPEGFRGSAAMQRLAVQANAGERVVVCDSLEVREPSLWWPQGYGPQHQYAVQAKLGADSMTQTVGFCSVTRDGEEVLVNGRPVRLRGFRWHPGSDPVADIERAAAANATVVRVEANAPPEALYDACDEAGILLWHAPSADGLEVADSEGEPNAKSDGAADGTATLRSSLERRASHHPSASLYGVTTERSQRYDGPYESGFLSKLRFRFRAWRASAVETAERVDSVAETIATALPDEYPVISRAGPPGTDPDATQLALGWEYLAAEDVEWLLESNPSLGETVAGIDVGTLTDEDVDPETVSTLESAAFDRRFDADDGRETLERYQVRTLKTVVEALRRRESKTLVASPIQDRVPGGGLGVVSHDGEEKPAYRALSHSFEPVQAVLESPPTPGEVGIVLCNDTHAEREVIVGWTAGENEGETTVSVGPLETAAAGTADVPRDATEVHLSVHDDDRSISNRYHL